MRLFVLLFAFCAAFIHSLPSGASKFHLKNMPAEHAALEGAIVKKDSHTIVIMTKTGLTIRALDSIEILDETPVEDNEFIRIYGPNNLEYQKYLFPKTFKPKPKKEGSFTFGYKSIAEPDEKYELKPQFKSKQLEYTIVDATFTFHLHNQERKENRYLMSFLVNILHSSYITHVDHDGTASMKIHNDKLGLTFFVNNRKFSIPSWMLGKKEETETIRVKSNGEVEGMDQSYDPEHIFDSPTEFMQDISRDLFFMMPDKPVAVGDSWKKNRQHVDDDTGEFSRVDLDITLLDVVAMDGDPVAILSADLDFESAEFVLDQFAANIEHSPFEGGGIIKAKRLNLSHNTITYFNLKENKIFYNKEFINVSGVMEGQKDNITVTMNLDLDVEASIKVTDQKPG